MLFNEHYVYILVRYEVLTFIAPITNTAFIGQNGKTAVQVGEEELQSDYSRDKETRSAIVFYLKELIKKV